MKNITKYIVEASSSVSNGDLKYVMSFKAFKTWITTCDKNDKFITVALVDTDLNLDELESSQYSKTFYDETEKNWVAGGDSGNLAVDEWTLSDNDIILVYEK